MNAKNVQKKDEMDELVLVAKKFLEPTRRRLDEEFNELDSSNPKTRRIEFGVYIVEISKTPRFVEVSISYKRGGKSRGKAPTIHEALEIAAKKENAKLYRYANARKAEDLRFIKTVIKEMTTKYKETTSLRIGK